MSALLIKQSGVFFKMVHFGRVDTLLDRIETQEAN